MMPEKMILRLIGYGLLLLGAASATALFVRASLGKEKISEGPGMSTLWGLFITGLVAGILALAGVHYIR